VAGQWFSPGTLVSSTNKIDRHNITEILLKVPLNTITLILTLLNYSSVSILVETKLFSINIVVSDKYVNSRIFIDNLCHQSN